MKDRIAILITILMLATSNGQVTINEVIVNQKKSGEFLLDQGYKGRLKVLTGKNFLDKRIENEFEFTHAFLNDEGFLGQDPAAQQICVGADIGPRKSYYRMMTIYSKELPDARALISVKTMDELIRILGKPRSILPNDLSISSAEWNLFSLNQERSLDVISVLALYKKDGEKMSLLFLRVAKGVFRPTGASPRIEKEIEQASTEQPGINSESKSESSNKPQPESEERSR